MRYAWVYARVSPRQKEEILVGLKDAGYTTLMCGDGTNDVGSLKRANVGLAIVNNREPTKEEKVKKKTISMFLKPADMAGLSTE